MPFLHLHATRSHFYRVRKPFYDHLRARFPNVFLRLILRNG